MTAVVILVAVLGIGLVWLLTLGLCFSVRRRDEQWDPSELPTTKVVNLRAVPLQGAYERRCTERRGSQERRGRPSSRDDLTG
jgi:hypothetical protein